MLPIYSGGEGIFVSEDKESTSMECQITEKNVGTAIKITSDILSHDDDPYLALQQRKIQMLFLYIRGLPATEQ